MFLLFWKLLALHFLFTQVILYPSWVSDGVEDETVIVTDFLVTKFRKETYIKDVRFIRLRNIKACQVVAAHTFNPSTWEAEAGRPL